jgi:two-component system phosphate regulon response regulator PhoB
MAETVKTSRTILIVEDEEDLVQTLEYNLRQEGYETRAALTGKEALEQARREPLPDLVLLDLMLPDLPGTEVCRRLRQDPATRSLPVLMVTAKGEEIDRVVGFEMGADDYVVKPFSVRELLLRVRAILRRAGASETAAPTPSGEEAITLGRLRIDPQAHRVWVDEEEVQLTALEFKLLALLARRRGRVQTRDQLLEDVWDMPGDLTTRTVDTHVKRLRQKLGPAGAYIETLRGVGYRMCDDPAP